MSLNTVLQEHMSSSWLVFLHQEMESLESLPPLQPPKHNNLDLSGLKINNMTLSSSFTVTGELRSWRAIKWENITENFNLDQSKSSLLQAKILPSPEKHPNDSFLTFQHERLKHDKPDTILPSGVHAFFKSIHRCKKKHRRRFMKFLLMFCPVLLLPSFLYFIFKGQHDSESSRNTHQQKQPV
eukprot:gb/GEZJ01006707.1/.p1 GENE.gb/GEZJ01006707.1/~~gb/GEZJ01006707.1/.p1  ORF type:complete len:183 (-),score=25.38 gb/GEZJ01006707.1/:110-658(-)